MKKSIIALIALTLLMAAVPAAAQRYFEVQQAGTKVSGTAQGSFRLNFVSGVTCVFNAATNATDCTGTGGSGSPAGSNQQIQYNDSSSFAGAVGAVIDKNFANVTASSRAYLALTNTVTSGNGSNSAHVQDINCNSTANTALNTLACSYSTLLNNATVGQLGHGIGYAIRYSDNSTAGASVVDFDGLYVEANNTAGTTATGGITNFNNINLANQTLASTSQTIANFNGLKWNFPALGANTVITLERALNLGAIRPTTAQVVTSQLINAGGCTDTSVYLPAVFCGGRVDIQTSLLMSGATMNAASAAPQTLTQPYIIKISAFHDVTNDVTVDLLTTSGNGASGTGVGLRHIYDVGGSSGNMTLVDSSEFQYKSSGGVATATRANAISVLGPTGSGVITTGVGVNVKAQKAGGVATGYAFWSEGTADFNRMDGQVGIHKIPTTTSTLAIAGLPTSSAGLVTGDVWANANVLTIIP